MSQTPSCQVRGKPRSPHEAGVVDRIGAIQPSAGFATAIASILGGFGFLFPVAYLQNFRHLIQWHHKKASWIEENRDCLRVAHQLEHGLGRADDHSVDHGLIK